MKLYIVRHGQTLFNLKGRIQGWCDSFLTEEGVAQAIAVGKGLQSIPFEAAYASTSERAIDTANYIIEGRDVILRTKKGLKEMNFGTLEGEYEKDCLKMDGSDHDKGFVEYGGETIPSTSARMVEVLTEIAKAHDGDVLVVSHGGAIMCALLGLFGLDVQSFRTKGNRIANASVSIVEYKDGAFTLECIGDTTFLENGKRGS